MRLVIAEKPSVAKTIATVLGVAHSKNGYIENDDYIISWCVGHLVGLAMPEAYGQKYAEQPWKFENLPILPQEWSFVVKSATKDQYNVLKMLMSKNDVTEIICATDAGREGECIFRYVYNLTGCTKPVKRLWTSSLEESAIRKGFDELRDGKEYDNLFNAGLARAKADWLVGFNATRLFSVRYRTMLSIGRVQTPTLAMIVDRNYRVTNFIKEKFYTVDLNCGEFIASSERIDNEETANNLQSITNNQSATIKSVNKQIKTVNPPKLYDLTTLQREANRQFGYTAQQTLDYTQALYEKKLCTYPRTDSQYITDDMENTALSLIDCIYTVFPDYKVAEFEPNIKRSINNEKVSDHHAILPTAEICKSDVKALPEGEYNILSLLSLKLLCAVATPHKYESVNVELISEKSNSHIFKATGKKILCNGWKEIEAIAKKKSEQQEKTLPDLSEGQVFETVSSKVAEHYTSPPKQFTEDTLLSAMETAGNNDYDENSDVDKKGLGTPATRAGIIENLVDRQYVVRDKKNLIPTEKGIKLIECVPEEVKSPKMTAEWETKLQDIEKGLSSDTDFIESITDYINSLIGKYAVADTSHTFSKKWECIGVCPKCGKQVLDYPKTYACESGKDGCGFTIWKTISGKSISSAQAKKLLDKKKTDLIKVLKVKMANRLMLI
ncbi:MAG: DNA topoisomerase 3 [Acutalibacteraceae bacterium]|nr:DNA topoisomerase 3 [Acutalibacteraceae bacterium]